MPGAFSIDLKTFKQVKSPLPITREGEIHRIACPYCELGYAEVLVERSTTPGKGGEISVNLGNARECNKCQGIFTLTYKMQLKAKKLEEEKGLPYASPYHSRRS